MVIEHIARICHEANRAYCITLGDLSQIPWEDAPDWQKESAIAGVKFRVDNPDATPEKMHESWLEETLRGGWSYGSIKDAEAKTHPCVVEYAKLPREQQLKDYLFSAVVDVFIESRGVEGKIE